MFLTGGLLHHYLYEAISNFRGGPGSSIGNALAG